MKLKRARIQGYRCLDDVEVHFDPVTTFVGPNGVGKSSVLRALDWFFNGTKQAGLTDEDVFSGLEGEARTITVEVEFDSLTTSDRERLGKYAPDSVDNLIVWRRWANGEDKITGKARAFPPFEEVRRGATATDRRTAYNSLRSSRPELELPTASSGPAVEDAMLSWERAHPDQLEEAEVPGTNFFGFAGQGVMSGLFDYILVTADLRASEEIQDVKSAVIGRILERAVDRTAADAALADLVSDIEVRNADIQQRHFAAQLAELSVQLTQAVGSFTTGRTVQVSTQDQLLTPPRAQFRVSILDHSTETRVDRQGHGFQRALLISALQILAQRSRAQDAGNVICLAIEEPELFQHPVQAKAFATVLRELAQDDSQGVQVTYATHSPYFVNPHRFEQIRRFSRTLEDGNPVPKVSINNTTIEDVKAKLAGIVDSPVVAAQMGGVAVNRLQDAFFAHAVVLVEGETDAAVIEGVAARTEPLFLEGIVAANVGGKRDLLLPWAILTLLGIPCYVVADGDKYCGSRMASAGKGQREIADAEQELSKANKLLLRMFSMKEEDWPSTQAGPSLAFFEDTIEATLDTDWPEWRTKHDEIADASLGHTKKHATIYRAATRLADGSPPAVLTGIVQAVKDIAGV